MYKFTMCYTMCITCARIKYSHDHIQCVMWQLPIPVAVVQLVQIWMSQLQKHAIHKYISYGICMYNIYPILILMGSNSCMHHCVSHSFLDTQTHLSQRTPWDNVPGTSLVARWPNRWCHTVTLSQRFQPHGSSWWDS